MTVWGATENGQTLGINSWWTRDGNVVTLHQEIRYRSSTPVSDGTNTLTWGGHLSGSQTPGINVSRWTGETVLKYLSSPHAIPTGSGISVWLQANIGRIEFVGDDYLDAGTWDTFEGFPNASSNLNAYRVNDGQINLSWNNNPANGAPVNNIAVDRWDSGSGAWRRVAWLGADTSWTDTSVEPNRSYAYVVYAVNGTGYSGGNGSNVVTTTPAAPSNMTATKSGTTIDLAWQLNSNTHSAVEIGHGVMSGSTVTWDSALLATLGAQSTSFSHTSADPSKVHVYRARTTYDALASSWTVSNSVQILVAPLAPTVTMVSVNDWSTTPLVVSWVHNTRDTTGQTAAQVQYRQTGTTPWTTVSTTSSSYTINAGTLANPKSYEFQVRTKGQHPDYGAWSTSKTVQGSATPTVTLSPTGTYNQSVLTIGLDYFDAESTAMAQAIVSLVQGSTVVETRTINATTYTFATRLKNDTAYVVKAKVQDGSGLWSQETIVNLTTEFLDPPKPVVVPVFDPDLGVVQVNITTPDPDDNQVSPDYVQLYRLTGDWVLVADRLSINGTATDYLPQLGQEVAYKAVAVSGTPSTAESNIGYVTTQTPWLFVNGGPGFATRARLKGNASVGYTSGRTKVLHTFAGNEDATEFIGVARTNVYKVSGSVGAFERSSAYGDFVEFEVIGQLPAPLCYRDPLGRRVFGSISDVNVNLSTSSEYATVDFTVTKVGYSE